MFAVTIHTHTATLRLETDRGTQTQEATGLGRTHIPQLDLHIRATKPHKNTTNNNIKSRQHALPWTQASGRARSLPPCQRKSVRVSLCVSFFCPPYKVQHAKCNTESRSTDAQRERAHTCVRVCVSACGANRRRRLIQCDQM